MEKWDAYYPDGSLVGYDLIRGNDINDGICHLVCNVIVQHSDGDYLVMLRDFDKDIYPGMFEATAGGSAIKGERPIDCIRRELYEETGIVSDEFIEFSRSVDVKYHMIRHDYYCLTSLPKDAVKLQKGETIDYMWLNKADFIDMLSSDKFIINTRISSYYDDIMLDS